MLLIYGSFVQDQVWRVQQFPSVGQTCVGSFGSGPGGKGFNQAVAAARQGAPVRFVGAIGDDAIGQSAQALARAEGIEAEWFVTDQPTASAGILVDPNGRNMIVVALSANLALTPEALFARAIPWAQARVLLCQLEGVPACTLAALQNAARAGATTILNPAPAPDFVLDHAWRQAIEILTPNETEFCALVHALGGPQVAPEFTEVPDHTLHQWCRILDVPTVVLTLGAHGVFVSHSGARRGDQQPYYRLPAEPVSPVDTTGAGDAFNGALAASLVLFPERAFSAHVRFANQIAGLSTERAGAAMAMPRMSDWQARFTTAPSS